jgi:FkbM family methyltransferase
MLGSGLRKISELVVSPGERIWIRVPTGIAKGLWIKVLPKWEPGYLTGSPEEGMNVALCRHLKRGDCFYDVGAHIGFYSMIAARLVGQAGHVIAFEPDADNAKTIRENAAKNGFPGISVVCAAMSDRDGIVRFFQPSHGDQSRMSGMVIRENLSGIREAEIHSCPAVSLDNFCSLHPTPNLVKIDVEGAELQVLEGAQSLLREKKPVLIIEVHHQQGLPAICSLLSGLGYILESVGQKAGEAQNFVASVRP